jgi:hypothetical protein
MAQQQSGKRQIRLEIPSNLSAVYANAVIVSQTHSEIILDFTQVMPNDPRARIQTRVAMTPANAKAFLRALEENLNRFEARHGEITMPPRPESLADQLFGAVRNEGDGPDDDESESDDDK